MDEDFINDLQKQMAEQIRSELDIEDPQEEDEFTASWFAANVSNSTHQKAKRILAELVREGRVSVRKNVKITWSVGKPNGCYGDVYRWIGKKKTIKNIANKSTEGK